MLGFVEGGGKGRAGQQPFYLGSLWVAAITTEMHMQEQDLYNVNKTDSDIFTSHQVSNLAGSRHKIVID